MASINLAALLYPILNFLWTAEIEALLDSITKFTASSYNSSSSSDDSEESVPDHPGIGPVS